MRTKWHKALMLSCRQRLSVFCLVSQAYSLLICGITDTDQHSETEVLGELKNNLPEQYSNWKQKSLPTCG